MQVEARLPGGNLIGVVASSSCFINSVWVRQDMRRKGFATRLLVWLTEMQRGIGIHDFYLWVLDGNTAAICMYEKMGFTQTARPSGLGIAEAQFFLQLNGLPSHEELVASLSERQADYRNYGVSYLVALQQDTQTWNDVV
jgi:hypothetical protein